MAMLIAGLVIWVVIHAFPAVAPASRAALQQKLGKQPYRGLFSLLILAALLLIVFGWKAAVPGVVYTPPLGPGIVSSVLVLAGLILFFAAQFNGHLKRITRHPQMTGTIFWAIAHLLTNGDTRSVALFGTLAVWALFEIVMINRRDGPVKERPAASGKHDIIAVVIGVVAFAVVGHFHMQLFNVSPLPV